MESYRGFHLLRALHLLLLLGFSRCRWCRYVWNNNIRTRGVPTRNNTTCATIQIKCQPWGPRANRQGSRPKKQHSSLPPSVQRMPTVSPTANPTANPTAIPNPTKPMDPPLRHRQSPSSQRLPSLPLLPLRPLPLCPRPSPRSRLSRPTHRIPPMG